MSSYPSTTSLDGRKTRSAEKKKDRAQLWMCFLGVVLIGPLLTVAYLFGTRGIPTIGPTTQDQQSHGAIPAAGDIRAQPSNGLRGTYLQLAASPHPESLLERLRKSGFPAADVEIPGRPGMHRVLVGPLMESQVAETRAQLEGKGLQGNAAIRRVF